MQNQVAGSSDWTELLDKIASGPPTFSPFKLLDPLVNLNEMFIHHEDIRRAQPGWEPEILDAQTVKALTRPLPVMARLTMAKVPATRESASTVATTPSAPSATPDEVCERSSRWPQLCRRLPIGLMATWVGREPHVDPEEAMAAFKTLIGTLLLRLLRNT